MSSSDPAVVTIDTVVATADPTDVDASGVDSGPIPTVDPNFTGTWQSTSHDNMAPFLRAKGFNEANAQTAARATVVQRIRHTRRRLLVEVVGEPTLYAITGGHLPAVDPVAEAKEAAAEDEAEASDELAEPTDLASSFLGKTAEWIGKRRRRLLSSTGEIDTERELLAGADGVETMVVTVTASTADGPIKATTTFVRKSTEVAFESERKQ